MSKLIVRIGSVAFCCTAIFLSSCSTANQNKTDKSYVIRGIIPKVTSSSVITIQPDEETTKNEDISTENEVTTKDDYIAGMSDRISIEKIEADTKEALESLGSVYDPNPLEIVDEETIDLINSMPAKSIIKVYTVNAATLAGCFQSQEITPSIYNRMENKSYSEGCTTNLSMLRYVRVLHYGFDGEIHIGELVVNQMIVEDILDIFKELFDEKYPIEQMVLIDEYDADDNKSMEANNTSCFNFRLVDGTTNLSKHAYGLAVDINPLYNPYVRTIDGQQKVLPENALEYVDRTLDCEYYIQKDDALYKAFTKRGFTWGGDWMNSKDYQHFQKVFH